MGQMKYSAGVIMNHPSEEQTTGGSKCVSILEQEP